MITVIAECTAEVLPQDLMDRIWSGLEWRTIQRGITGLAIEYDDGRHQSVQVCVDWRRRYHAMSIMRFRDSAARISFFYSRPPEGVAQQTGVWEAIASHEGSRLRSIRTLQLQRSSKETEAIFDAREAAYGISLKEHLERILCAVAHGAKG